MWMYNPICSTYQSMWKKSNFEKYRHYTLKLQAMIDTSAENGWLSVCLSSQMLMQAIVQARWPTDSPLTTLPHVDPQHLYMFSQMTKDTNKPCTMLNGLKVACLRNYELLAKYLRREFEENQIEQIYKVKECYIQL